MADLVRDYPFSTRVPGETKAMIALVSAKLDITKSEVVVRALRMYGEYLEMLGVLK